MSFQDEVRRGARFRFGRNWQAFLEQLTDDRIASSEDALSRSLGEGRLAGATFLDVGSGSGLSSLAARRLGAKVCSFDYDPDSVACTRSLRDRFFPGDPRWEVLQGSVLDAEFMRGLGTFEVVYSWGVLHHTGAMWEAVDLTAARVAPDGLLELALYNDQGYESVRWRGIKKRFNELPPPLRLPYALAIWTPRELRGLLGAARTGSLDKWMQSWTNYHSRRGMSRLHDIWDWVGGYPFEVAKPEEVVERVLPRGFRLERLRTVGGGLGCNEFVFRREARGA